MKADQKIRIEDRMGPKSSIIASDARFKGKIEGKDSIRIVGYFEGEIKIEGLVWIEKDGKIVGTIEAPYIIIEGEIEGDIISARQIEIRRKGKITGNIKSDILAMAEGSVVQGEISMSGKAGDAPITIVEKRQHNPIKE